MVPASPLRVARVCSSGCPEAANSGDPFLCGAGTGTVGAVRRAGVEDAGVLGGLLYDFNVEFDSPTPAAEEFASRLWTLLSGSPLTGFLSHDDAGRATGFALITERPTPYFDGPIVQLEELYVRPDVRDRGIGSALLAAVVGFPRERGSEELHIGVDESDTDTRRFYERHGFVNIRPGEEHRMLLYLRGLG